MEDDEIRDLVKRLARPHRSGGVVIERAAIVAEGGDAAAVVAWIGAHKGEPEEAIAVSSRGGGGLHGSREQVSNSTPRRYVLPPGALSA
jgi:hypothetical protein